MYNPRQSTGQTILSGHRGILIEESGPWCWVFLGFDKKRVAAPSSNRTELLSITAISDTRSREVSAINVVSLADNLLRRSDSFSPSALAKSNTTLGSGSHVIFDI
jgi:hypothetical protein